MQFFATAEIYGGLVAARAALSCPVAVRPPGASESPSSERGPFMNATRGLSKAFGFQVYTYHKHMQLYIYIYIHVYLEIYRLHMHMLPPAFHRNHNAHVH